mmetsp:Transcript_21792/g.40557  ORF Transcript_21792/g.40557 Transcript_21792/m.40557 type:complete len:691 (-) Transcript_21792:78-2150(-)
MPKYDPQPDINDLKSKVASLPQTFQKQLESVRGALEGQLRSETERLTALIEQRSKQTVEQLAPLEQRQAAKLEEVRLALSKGFEASLSRVQSVADERESRTKKELEAPLASLAAKISKEHEESQAAVQASHQKLHDEVTSLQEKMETQVGEAEARVTASAQEKFLRQHEETEQIVKSLEPRFVDLKNDFHELESRIERTKESSKKANLDLAAALEDEQRKLSTQLRGELNDSAQEVRAACAATEAACEAKINSQVEVVQAVDYKIGNIHTRAVTWQLRGFRKRLYELLQEEERVVQSPGFHLCGQPEMVMDLIAAPTMLERPDEPVPPLPTSGSCSIRLWATPGLHLVFRLTLGDITQRYEHTFEAGELTDSVGRASYSIHNFCQLDQVWVMREKDQHNTFAIKLELLELRFSESIGIGATVYYDDVRAELEAAAILRDPGVEVEVKGDKVGKPENEMTLTRLLTSDVILQDRVQGQLQSLRNRTVRRVEWRLEGCSRILDICRAGEAIDSPVFSAAGLDRMQMHFYPRGVEVGPGAPGHSQACALYISGPSRTSVRGMMWVGSHSRQFEQRFQRRGDKGGRNRFCSLEHQLDCEDSVVVAVEVLEVEVDVPDQSASLLLRQVGSGAGGVSNVGSKGNLRMKREDPSKTEEVVRCISLPTLNTRAHFLPHVTGDKTRMSPNGNGRTQRSR